MHISTNWANGSVIFELKIGLLKSSIWMSPDLVLYTSLLKSLVEEGRKVYSLKPVVNISYVCCVSAQGQALSPRIIFKGEKISQGLHFSSVVHVVSGQ